jgi:DNA-binding YbaB/EbfC family protein
MFDLDKLLAKMGEAQSEVAKVEEQVKQIAVQAESGAGLVRVTMDGEKKVASISIDPSLLTTQEQQTLQDLLVAALRTAVDRVNQRTKEALDSQWRSFMPHDPKA